MVKALQEVDFDNIRPYQGSKNKAFEELVSQIICIETQEKGTFRRVEGAGGDGGVEGYLILQNGSEIGIQCKFINKITNSQWTQIQKSFYSAIKNHPRLAEYRIAVPIDRNPAQQKIWDTKIKKWNTYSRNQGIKHKIKFTWLGKSELTLSLCQTPYRQLLTYWFGTPEFTSEWMAQVIQNAVANLDVRYSPNEHVETDAGRKLRIFTENKNTKNKFKSLFLKAVKTCEDFEKILLTSDLKYSYKLEINNFQKHVKIFVSLEWPTIRLPNLNDAHVSAIQVIKDCQLLCDYLERKNEQSSENKKVDQNKSYDYINCKSIQCARSVEQWATLCKEHLWANNQKLLLLGDAGIGKSHILAAIVDEARKFGSCAILLLGEQFIGHNAPWSQLIEITGWNSDIDSLLAVLNQSAYTEKNPALICIDALNESDHKKLWISHLNAFANKLNNYPHVKLVVSCRSDFASITLPLSLAKGNDQSWAYLRHYGLGEGSFEAVRKYFERFDIKANHFPPLLTEFNNPLFLRLFCEAFESQELPLGVITIEKVIDVRIKRLCEKLEHDIDCSSENTEAAISTIAKAIQNSRGHQVEQMIIKRLIEPFSPSRENSRSLYYHLKSNGIIVEVVSGGLMPKDKKRIFVRLPFERFSEILVARNLLVQIKTVDQLKKEWNTNKVFTALKDPDNYYRCKGLARAFAILIPEGFKVELLELIDSECLKRDLLDDFLESLLWRSPHSFTATSLKLLNEACSFNQSAVLSTLLKCAVIPEHPYNAKFLHRNLLKYKLPERELMWTIPLSEMTESDGSNNASQIVQWAFYVSLDLVSDEQAYLVGLTLFWFLSSNHRAFRLRPTLAATRLLIGRCHVVGELLKSINDVDDPYVTERAYAVACGVAFRENNTEQLAGLTKTVFTNVYSKKYVNPHILFRDYAQTILEIAVYKKCLPSEIKVELFRPPFRTQFPRIQGKKKFNDLISPDEWRLISHSIVPNVFGFGGYGDFGRYVMQAHVESFSSISRQKRINHNVKAKPYDAELAQRWIAQRISELGWTPERFSQYDKNHAFSRLRADQESSKVERISKKYQWIALYEFLGYLSDHYYILDRWNNIIESIFKGAWQIGVRNFDPSQVLKDITKEYVEDSRVAEDTCSVKIDEYPNPFDDDNLNADRKHWVAAQPKEFLSLITPKYDVPDDSIDWLTLSGFYEWKEPEFDAFELKAHGQLKMWVHLRSWLVHQSDLSKFLKAIKKVNFNGNGCSLGSAGDCWLGEYPWRRSTLGEHLFIKDRDNWFPEIDYTYYSTVCEISECGYSRIPSPFVCKLLDLKWSGSEAMFINADNTLIASQLNTNTGFGFGPVVINKTKLIEALEAQKLSIVWGLVGEKDCFSYSEHRFIVPAVTEFSGIYHINNDKILGGINKIDVRVIKTE